MTDAGQDLSQGVPAGFVRVAGRLELADGATLSWSAADGSRGRRWRAVSMVNGSITTLVLLEVDLRGRPSRLEVTTRAGMLTLHPSPDGREIHGNVVSSAGRGVRHLAFPWGPQHELELAGRPGPTIVALHRRQAAVPIGASVEVEVLVIGLDLAVVAGRRRFERLSTARWRVTPSGTEFEIDPDGLPVGGARWALESD